MFTIYPAIDLLNGKCVRLIQGDYGQSTVYSDSPVMTAKTFLSEGAQWLHIVDLDGARQGRPLNRRTIEQIAAEVPVHIEVGGGIRNMETVDRYLDRGVGRVILGSSAIADPEFVRLALSRYPDSIAIGLDVKRGKVAVKGWLEVSELSAADLAKRLIGFGARHFIYTNISRDGALKGADQDGAGKLAAEIGMPVVVSGGVSSTEELAAMVKMGSGRISGAIIGKAIYTQQISLRKALKVVDVHAG